jgi:hypothetical protein
MRLMRWQALLALPIVLLAACGRDEPPRPPRAAVLLFTPKLPGSVVVDTGGTEEAERLTLVVPVSGDSVARYYRNLLGGAGWVLTNDRSSGGLIDLYARGGPVGTSTLWIHIERQDTVSARYTLIAVTPTTPLDSTMIRIGPSRPRDAAPRQTP